jgi:4-amino-4-deoxy-L-arabinose transferase-like glycosyltransferase
MPLNARATTSDLIKRAVSLHPDAVTIVVLGAVVVGATLRIVGLRWGLPIDLHPDEPVVVKGALDLAMRHSFEPRFFDWPGHVEIQLSYLAYWLYSDVVKHTDVLAAHARNPGPFLLISRSITALFGIAMVILAYLIGRRIDRWIGAIAAVLFALTPMFVLDSHWATPDIPLTCMLMVATLASMQYLAKPRVSSLLLACGAVAVGIAIKYPAAIALIVIAAVVIIAALRERRYARVVAHGLLAMAAVVVFLFFISPVLFTNLTAVQESLSFAERTAHPGADGLGWGGNLVFYAHAFLVGCGLLIVVAFLVGIAAAIRNRIAETVPLLIGGVYWVVLSAFALHWDRWGLPMYITPLFFAGIGGVHAYRWASGRRWRTPVAWILAALAVTNMTLGAATITANFAAPDARLAARTYLAGAGVTVRNTSYEGYSPLRPGAPKTVFAEFTSVNGRVIPRDPRIRYLILSSCMYSRYLDEPKYVEEQAFYSSVDREFSLLASYPTIDPTAGRSGFEPTDIIHSIGVTASYLRGGMGGCDLKIFAVR